MKKTALIVLDGWGRADNPDVSAIDKANTPFVDSLYKDYPQTWVKTSGLDVGLPAGQMGNSEVGHMNIGSGRIISMDLGQINLEMENKNFLRNEALLNHIQGIKKNNGRAHLMGLFSNGGVHGHINHLIT